METFNNDNTILEVKNLKQHFPIKQGLLQKTVGYIKAVDGVNFSLEKKCRLALDY